MFGSDDCKQLLTSVGIDISATEASAAVTSAIVSSTSDSDVTNMTANFTTSESGYYWYS